MICLKNFLYPFGLEVVEMAQSQSFILILIFLADGPSWFKRQHGRPSLLSVHARVARSCDDPSSFTCI